MLKKICLGVVFIASVAMAEIPVIKQEFESLLRKNGVVAKNTLRIEDFSNGDGHRFLEAKGDLIATGVLVSTPNDTYFYPDRNLKNLFYDMDKVREHAVEGKPKTYRHIKPSKNIPVQVYGDDVVSKVFGAAIYGSQAARVKIHITSYIYSYDEDEEAFDVTTKDILLLTPAQKLYKSYPTKSILTREMSYVSKDDFINIRNAPQGEIIGRITKADMQKKPKGGILIGANCELLHHDERESDDEAIECPSTNGWYEVFYFPPGVRKGKDALHGYIHTSQVKLKPSDLEWYGVE